MKTYRRESKNRSTGTFCVAFFGMIGLLIAGLPYVVEVGITTSICYAIAWVIIITFVSIELEPGVGYVVLNYDELVIAEQSSPSKNISYKLETIDHVTLNRQFFAIGAYSISIATNNGLLLQRYSLNMLGKKEMKKLANDLLNEGVKVENYIK